jgi:hypothetical protein
MPFPLALLAGLIPTLATLIPDIGRLIAGQAGEEVGQVVQRVVGSVDPTTVAATLAADEGKAGELLRQIEEIRARLRQAELEEETKRIAAALQDVQSARKQAVDLATVGSGIAWASTILSAIILLGFFGCIFLLFLVDKRWDERLVGMANVLFGALTVAFAQVCNYWLGSSRGSAAKDDRMAAVVDVIQKNRVTSGETTRSEATSEEPPSRLFPRRTP